jgi:YidC/Oxa1 family membrane protein insertase
MFDKKFFLALILSVLTVWGLQRYFGANSNVPQAPAGVGSVTAQPQIGQPVKVATTQDLYRPLNMDIKFKEEKLESEVLIDVQTKHYKASFSNYGAVLTNFEYNEHHGKNGFPIKTVYKKGALDEKLRAEGCFLLALEADTPFLYKFLYRQDKKVNSQLKEQDNVSDRTVADSIEVAYQAETAFWTITKIYTLYQNNYRIDFTTKFEPKIQAGIDVKPLRARILFAAPFVNEVPGNNLDFFVYNENKDCIDKIDPTTVKDLFWFWSTQKGMFGAEDKYFAHCLIDDPSKFVQRAYIKMFENQKQHPVLEGPELKAAQSYTMSFYMGPKVLDELSVVDSRLVDLLSFGWLSWLCKLLLKLLYFLFSFLGNYGWAIVVMTVLLRIPFAPLSIYGRKKMEEYQKYQPTIQRIRQKYKTDLQMQNQELMKFHKDHNLSTATPILGCLPMLIQMPILFALYKVLGSYLALYQAPFVGWIIDLSAKDPYYVLPVIMGLTMLWQQIITPSGDEKQKIMMYFVSVVITVLFANFPAGLVLYWATNNIITIAEDYLRRFALR